MRPLLFFFCCSLLKRAFADASGGHKAASLRKVSVV
jgi:hypothetical protein